MFSRLDRWFEDLPREQKLPTLVLLVVIAAATPPVGTLFLCWLYFRWMRRYEAQRSQEPHPTADRH